MRRFVRAAALLLAAGACGDDPIEVRGGTGAVADYNGAALTAAIDRFVAAGRTPEAYGALAQEVAALRGGMDETVAEQAELHMTVLAAGPVEALRGEPAAVQTQRLGTTVWPVALAPAIEVRAPDGWRDPAETAVVWKAGEAPAAYVRRLCEGPLAVDCRHVVPEWQGAIVGAEAIERMTRRVRTAVANCEECADPSWREAVTRWEVLDREATAERLRIEERGATGRWPVAGAAAAPWPEALPLVEIEPDGDWILAGTPIAGRRRADVLRELREDGTTLGVHVAPDARVEALEVIAATAAAAGYREVAVQTRVDAYPWELRAYRLPVTKAARLGRATDTVQVYLRGLDLRASAPATGGGSAAARRR